MTPLLLSATTATTCLGRGLAATRSALREGRSGLAPCAFETVELATWIGEVPGVDNERLPAPLAAYDCRNNRLTQMALETDGFAERVRQSDEIQATFVRPFNGGVWLTVSFLSFVCIILLPRQFHVTVVENNSEREIKRARWLFPVYLVL